MGVMNDTVTIRWIEEARRLDKISTLSVSNTGASLIAERELHPDFTLLAKAGGYVMTCADVFNPRVKRE